MTIGMLFSQIIVIPRSFLSVLPFNFLLLGEFRSEKKIDIGF